MINYIERVNQAFNAGFLSAAAKKCAMDYLNRAADEIKKTLMDEMLNRREALQINDSPEHNVYWFNYDLHLWNAKRKAALLAIMDEPVIHAFIAEYDTLAEMRAEIKNAEIIKAKPNEYKEREERIYKSVREIMELRKEQVATGLHLYDLFGGLPVTANVHMVIGSKGTTFMRTFYYMAGKLTPLQVILYSIQEGERRKEEKNK